MSIQDYNDRSNIYIYTFVYIYIYMYIQIHHKQLVLKCNVLV
jgi:hypothetical protein